MAYAHALLAEDIDPRITLDVEVEVGPHRLGGVVLHAPRRRVGALPSPMRLTYNHTGGMVCHMKTTLNIDDSVMGTLREALHRAMEGR